MTTTRSPSEPVVSFATQALIDALDIAVDLSDQACLEAMAGNADDVACEALADSDRAIYVAAVAAGWALVEADLRETT